MILGRPEQDPGEGASLALAAHLVHDAASFVDVGAHLGYYVFQVRGSGFAGPVHWFEPHPELAALLRSNVARSGYTHVHGHEAALGAAPGRQVFHMHPVDPSQGTLEPREGTLPGPVRDVAVLTLDALLPALPTGPLCLKVDVENAEMSFLDGGRHALERVDSLIMEVLGPGHEQGVVERLIREHGMHAYYVHGRRLEHSPDGRFTYTLPNLNWLFCRQDPAALRDRLRGTGFQVAVPNENEVMDP